MIESTLILWGFGLLGAAVLVFAIELFIPSGGVLGVVAILLTISGIAALWRESWIWGVTSTGIVLIITPMALNLALKIIPNTPMGRRMFLQKDPEQVEAERKAEQARLEQEQALIGAVGTAMNDLHPIGTAQIEGAKIEVLAEGGAIDAGTPVRVTKVEGNQVKVRAI